MRTQAIIALLFATLFSINSSAQIDFFWEPFLHEWEAGVDPPELVALNGFVTWKLYVEIDAGDPDIPDYVSSVVGEDSGSDVLTPLVLEFDCCPWQHPLSSELLGSNLNPNFFTVDGFTDLPYDSFVTIGAASSADMGPGCTISTAGDDWADDFENCNTQGVVINSFAGGGWFQLPQPDTCPNGFTDENGRVLIGQFTLQEGCQLQVPATLCVQYFADGITGGTEFSTTECVELLEQDLCFNNPIFTDAELISDVLCFEGNEGLIQIDSPTGGSGDFTIELIGPNGEETQDNPDSYENLVCGDYTYTVLDEQFFDQDGVNCQYTEMITVDCPDEGILLSSEVITNIQCITDTIGVVEITVNGGTPFTTGNPYTVTSNLGVSPEFTAPNVFSFDSLYSTIDDLVFTVLDFNGCSAEIAVPPLGPEGGVIVEGTFTDVTCNGANNGTISLTTEPPNAAITIVWDPVYTGIDQMNLVGLTPGVYTANIDDGVSCPIDLEFTISEPDPIVITGVSASTIDCFGDCNGTLTYVISGGTGTYVEDIVQDGGFVTNGEICAGEVELIVTDSNGCVMTEDSIFPENDEILLNEVVTNVTCNNGSDGSICIGEASGGASEVLSSTITPNADFDGTCYTGLAGDVTYTITLTDDIGCSRDFDIFISQPDGFIVNPEATDVTCFGLDNGSIITGLINGGTTPYDISITIGAVTTTEDDGVFENLAPGNYTLTIVDDNECEYTDDTLIITEPEELVVTEIISTSPSCGGDLDATAEVIFSGGVPNYLFNFNDTGITNENSASNLPGDENVVTIIDGNGCELVTEFEIDQPTPLTVDIMVTNVTCTGMCDGTIQFFPVGGTGSISSFTVTTDAEISNMTACEGIYPISVIDSVGCSVLDTIRVEAFEVSDIEYAVFSTPVSCWNTNDGTATIAVTGGNGVISYQWSDPNLQTTATAIGLVEDFYTITITDEIGCTFTENVVIEPTIGCFFISNALTPNGDSFNDEWILGGLEYFPDARVEVYNRWGQQVFESIGTYTPWDGKFNSNRLPVADYYYVITFDPNSEPLTGTVTLKY